MHIFLFSIVIFFLSLCQPVQGQLPAGTHAKDFTLMSTEGESISLSEVIALKPVVLIFFSTSCSKCRGEIPHLRKMAATAEKHNIAFYAIASRQSKTIVDRYFKQHMIDYEALLDREGTVRLDYDVMEYPNLFIINTDGIIIHHSYEVPENYEEIFDSL